jgi:hypothetical protein
VLETALITFLIGAQIAAPQPSPTYHVQQISVNGEAELVTLFGHSRSSQSGYDAEVPLLSVLRDTLGSPDPDSTRLRYVWILTSSPPTPLQRAASALSFVWFRTGSKPHADHVPKPVLDLASPAKSVWTNMLGNGLQALELDPMGAAIRSSTRSYRGNSSDYRKLQIFRALGALDGLERQGGSSPLPAAELREVYSRLSLADRTFGGLVRPASLSKVYDKVTGRLEEIRGHNWELLRQRAESNGLYFEPLALAGRSPAEALLWISRSDLETRENRRFEKQFLGIANPWCDDRLLHWNGYSETRYFDDENRLVAAETPGAHAVEMIPLALYSLDYPRVPLLLVDFRSSYTPKRHELVKHGASLILTGLLRITTFGNWSFLAAEATWTFVRGRQGAPTDRSARLRSYSEAREFLAVDSSVTPELRTELLRRLDHLALNPLENGLETETTVAKEQYAALVRYADSPTGLAARLQHDRQKELDAATQPSAKRLLLSARGVFGDKPSGNQERERAILRGELEARRRTSSHVRYLEELLASSPRPEIVRDSDEIRMVIEELTAEPFADPRVPHLIARVFARSEAIEIRIACLQGLQRLDIQEARDQLWRLSRDTQVDDWWRSMSLAYFNGDAGAAQAVVSGQP